MPVHNADIARVFAEIADLLELENGNPFRVRAYRNAARIVEGQRVELAGLLAQGKALPKLPGIGADLSAKIAEIAATGTCRLREQLTRRAPGGITELLRLPGLGPKRVQALYRELDVHTPAQLQRAAQDGRLHRLPGFGEKTEAKLLEAARAHLSKAHRFKLALAGEYARSLLEHLRQARGVGQAVVAGSFRRMKETVGDLDVLVTAADATQVMRRFAAYGEVKQMLASGATRASAMLACGIQVDLRVVPPESFGAALHYFTGSKAHNIAVRRLGQERGLKINEYGVFKGKRRVAGETEESVYAAVGLPYIEPELREDQGEIEAARRGALPRLVTRDDLAGDLHAHTRATDGRNTLREMAEGARAHGLAYLGITEHSRRETMAHGLDPVRLAKQIDEIERLNRELRGVTLLKGIEVDILEDGSLDLPDSVLARLDLVIGAVHSKFNLSRARQTERILAAMERPHFSILAHPSGRLIDAREPYDVDMLAVIRKARAQGVFLELNAHPERLDLTDVHCRMAKDEGVLVALDSDAHDVDDFDNLAYGIGQARRGWLEKKDLLNTRPLAEVGKLLAAHRGGR
ncbi:MAG TPA: DNA polymerase/3'-5' exonuclease PolX [Burkholderiales bacterium]|nr:DNA polymerase/3'-5' exonuclease PolX [Burkholderiales bacterium]